MSELNETLIHQGFQRAGLSAIISGILSIDCTDSEAVALQITTANTLIDVVNKFPVGDAVDMQLMENALEFAEKGIAKEQALAEAKDILNGEGE